jgi:hypothetical protein
MTIDDILRLLRHKIKIEITISLDEGAGKYTAKCPNCSQTLGIYSSEDSAKRAIRTHRQHCTTNKQQNDLMNWINEGDKQQNEQD